MKRLIPSALAAAFAGLLIMSGCSEKKCGSCGTVEQQPCCGAQSGGTATTEGARPMEHRTETGRSRPATRPAR